MDYAEAAKRHRYQAEEARTKADLMLDEGVRTQYLRVAAAYDAMADKEELQADGGRRTPPVVSPDGDNVPDTT
jgi:hypothetical protein